PYSLRRLAARHPGVTLRSEDGADLALWRTASTAVAPYNSAATRRHMLHALAGGVPVVTTTPVCDELAITPGQHALVAATPEDFAAAVARLAGDPVLGRLLALRGRRLVADRYDIPVALTGLGAAYEHVLVGASRCVLCS
ncbi:MAG: glycosyltransferase, partial [Ktedonobacterales bacterium]